MRALACVHAYMLLCGVGIARALACVGVLVWVSGRLCESEAVKLHRKSRRYLDLCEPPLPYLQ